VCNGIQMFKGGDAMHDTSDEYGAKNTADSHLDSFSLDFFDTKYHTRQGKLGKTHATRKLK
jgi:hypothetical protein